MDLEFKFALELMLLLGYTMMELLWVMERFSLLAEVDVDRFLGFLVKIEDW